ncbi:3-hydroxyisobutyrate dehydrogenase [Aureimonas sp. Leaf454]|nr:3-hydroxyisobutyrate dehydrogenase [Aureimonas sp. Leaf454]
MTERTTGTKVGIIGLGSMGLGMAKAALAAGLDVAGYDVADAQRDALEAAGGRVGTSAADAAQGAEILVVVVVNAAQTERILFGEGGSGAGGGAAAGMAPGGVVVSCATMAPADARRLAASAEAAGLLYLDAPMSGGAARASTGELTFMASGTPAAFDKAKPAVDAMAATVHRLGDEAGIGASFKMVNQLLAGVHIAAACEAMTFAAKLGLDLAKVYEVITQSAGNSWMFENRVPHILDADYAPRSAVEIFVKDLGIVADMGRAERFPTQLAGAALQMYLMTSAAGMGRDDDASVARMIAGVTGVTLPKGED